MVDKAKLISAMKCWIGDPLVDCRKCAYFEQGESCIRKIIKDALELLKEQEAVVRCKDCIYRNDTEKGKALMWLPCEEVRKGDNWYCAEGERKCEDA